MTHFVMSVLQHVQFWMDSFIFCTNNHLHDRLCSMQKSLTLTYIFMVVQPWIWDKTSKICHISSCPLHTHTYTHKHLGGLFPYLTQMLTSMKGRFACLLTCGSNKNIGVLNDLVWFCLSLRFAHFSIAISVLLLNIITIILLVLIAIVTPNRPGQTGIVANRVCFVCPFELRCAVTHYPDQY